MIGTVSEIKQLTKHKSNCEKLPDAINVETLIACLNRALSGRSTSREKLNELARALSALPWSKMMIEQVGRRPINLVLARLIRTETDRSPLRELVATALRPINAHSSFAPNELEQCKVVMTQFSLHDQAGPSGWLPISHALQREGFMAPADIAGMNCDSILAIFRLRRLSGSCFRGRQQGFRGMIPSLARPN